MSTSTESVQNRRTRVIAWAGESRLGLVRKNNEDRWGQTDENLFVVADGIGGLHGGEVAADIAVRAALVTPLKVIGDDGSAVVVAMNEAVVEAGDRLGLPNMGTTAVVVAIREGEVVIVSVGDSRAYRRRGEVTELLTRDHTVRNQLLDAGRSLDDPSRRGPRLDALTSFIGWRFDQAQPVNTVSFTMHADDRFLVCTDGVHGQMTNEELGSALGAPTCQDAVRRLLVTAEKAGGRDNATAVVIDVADKEIP